MQIKVKRAFQSWAQSPEMVPLALMRSSALHDAMSFGVRQRREEEQVPKTKSDLQILHK